MNFIANLVKVMYQKNVFMKLLVVCCLVFSLFSFQNSVESTASGTGIKFSSATIQKAIKQAKSSGKLVFVDVYTTWCGQCKNLAATTFKDSKVGTYFNKNFINIKVDAENSESGAIVQKAYHVNAYPTLLFIDGEGKLVKKLVGFQTAEKLLSIAQNL